MSHPLEQRLRQVRRRVRGLLAIYGAARVVAATLGALIVVGLVDYLLRLRDPGLRLFCTLTVVGLLVWATYRHLLRALAMPWHDQDLARRLGRFFPAVGDALPSAIEFLHQREDDPTSGSFALRRAVVVRTTADVEKLDLLLAVRLGPVGKAVAAAFLILCAALGIVIAAPASAGVALTRLANPFGGTVWPQTTHLAILQPASAPPLRLVPYGTFAPTVRDLSNQVLPENLSIHYRFDPDSRAPRDEGRITQYSEVGRFTRRANVERPFAFRFLAGDVPWSDWCQVRVEDGSGTSAEAASTAYSSPVLVARMLPTPSAGDAERRLLVVLPQFCLERMAVGTVFETELIDAYGVRLPGAAKVFYRWQDDRGKFQEEEGTVQHLGSRLRLRRENVSRSFEYRVEAGDDRRMPWIPVEVLPAPTIDRHRTQVVPPDYTGLPPRQSETLVRAIVGSRVRILAEASRPLFSATFCSEEGQRIECRVGGSDRRSLETTFQVGPSTTYWFELTDVERLEGGRTFRWDVHAIPDSPPTVTIQEPAGNVFVTPQATVPLRISVKDDLSVRSIRLVYARDGAEAAETIPLYRRPEGAEPPEGNADGEVRSAEYAWALGDLALKPGSQVVLHAEADDALPQTGQSETRRVTVITAEELAERIATRQGMILSELGRALEMQREARRQTAEIETRLRQASAPSQPDVDQLRGAELNQRQVNRTLTAAGEGVPMQVAGLLADLDNNGIENPDVRRRMESILTRLAQLGREHLPQITLNLTAAIKEA
ncbi:MAG: DUF4175 family protein, partial [Thermoguttaceae bacterium]